MRVGMVCPYSLNLWGGVQSQVLGLARSMRRSGVDVQVLAPCDGLPPEPWVTPLGNSLPYAQNGSVAPVAPDPAAQLRMLRAISEERFDVLHLHEPLAPGPTLTAAVVRPVPTVGTFHASGEIAVYRYLKPLLSRLISGLDCRVAVSAEAADMAQRHLGGSYETLFNGVDLDRLNGAEPAIRSSPSVLFLGRHEPRKGLEVLLEASRLLPAEVAIWIGGSGPQTDELKYRYRDDDRLVWLGELSEGSKVASMAAADVFCVPSLGGESFGVVLLEGMAASMPVVASDLEAYRRTSRDGSDALLFPSGNPAMLAKCLLSALEGGIEVERQVARGRERAEEFSMDRLAQEYVIRYERVLESSDTPRQYRLGRA